jgi:hypothetical protein
MMDIFCETWDKIRRIYRWFKRRSTSIEGTEGKYFKKIIEMHNELLEWTNMEKC